MFALFSQRGSICSLFSTYKYYTHFGLREVAGYCREQDWDAELKYILLDFIHESDFSIMLTLFKNFTEKYICI